MTTELKSGPATPGPERRVRALQPSRRWRRVGAAVGALLLATAIAAPAGAVTVTPVILDLSTAGINLSGLVSVDDSFPTPLPVELTVHPATFNEKGIEEVSQPTDDLLVFPPTALIQPGRTQTFRIQYVGDLNLTASRHYIITVAQLPVKFEGSDSQIQVLYNFQVVVNVGPAGAKPRLAIDHSEISKNSAGKPEPVIYVKNDSHTYGYLSHGRLKVVELDAAGKQIFEKSYAPEDIEDKIGPGLVASGQTRRFELPLSLPAGEGRLEVSYSQAAD